MAGLLRQTLVAADETNTKMSASMQVPVLRLFGRRCLQGVCLNCRASMVTVEPSENRSNLAHQFKLASKRKEPRPLFRTRESNPDLHSMRQEGLFYTVPDEDCKRLFDYGGLGLPLFQRLTKTFTETSLMVRKPAIEIITYLKAADYQIPAIKYILYGRLGTGKTLSLAHVMHYCVKQNWLIVHAPWPCFWTKFCKEIAMSTYKPGRVDLPQESITWLKAFRQQNAHVLSEFQPKTQGHYTWSPREITEEGAPWSEVIELGLNRIKYAPDCVGVLLKEIQLQSATSPFKTLVAIDGVNGLWAETRIKNEERKLFPPSDVGMVHHFKKLLKGNWSNGAIVTTVDKNANVEGLRGSDLPRFLLQKEGFEWLDPFVPVVTEDYSDKEVHSCIEYYIDRLWIQNPKGHTEEGKKQLMFLSGNNPKVLCEVVSSW